MNNDSTSSTIYGIPVSELQEEPTQVEGGMYYKFSGFYLYVPDEIDTSTSAFIYYPGSGGPVSNVTDMQNLINNHSPNQVIIHTANCYADKNTGGAQYLELIENIGSENGIEITNIDTMGFSAGGTATYNTLVNIVQNYLDNGSHNAIFTDVVGVNVTQEQIDMLADNGAAILCIEPSNEPISEYEKKLARGGVDVVIGWVSGSHGEHVTLNREAIQNGIIDFVTGESDELANSDIYKFMTYDIDSSQWYEISLEEVAEKFNSTSGVSNPFRYYDKLRTMDTELKCNNSFLGTKINTIRVAIKNSNFLSTTSMESYSSTTQIPNVESDVVQAYFSSCAKTLNCLEKDTSRIIEIGNSIDEINDSLKKDATTLNNSVNYYTNSTSTRNDSTTIATLNTSSNSWASATTSYKGSTNTNTSYVSSISNTGVINTLATGVSSGVSSSYTNSEKVEEVTIVTKDKIYKYSQLYSDMEKNILVYKNTEDNYKIVVHYEGDKITGIDHYYQYPTQQEALNGIDKLKVLYNNDCTDVVRETNTVKVVMEESTYNNMTLSQLKTEYQKMNEIVEIKKEGE